MAALVGLGLDFHDSGRKSLPKFYAQVRSRISHASIVGLTSADDAQRFLTYIDGLPTIHHLSNVGPANPGGIRWDKLELQDGISRVIGAAWCNEDIGVWSLGPYNIPYFTPPLFEEDVARRIAISIRALQSHCSVPFLAELPSCSFVAGRLSLGEFFNRIVEDAGCDLVLDVAHVFSYALYTGCSPESVLTTLPLGSVVHVHVAGGRPSRKEPWSYIDNHDDPIMPQVMNLLGMAVTLCPRIRAITYEIGPSITDDQVLIELDHVNEFLEAVHFRPKLFDYQGNNPSDMSGDDTCRQ